MNFLQRYTSNISFKEQVPAHETPVETQKAPKVSGPLEGLVAEDPFPQSPMAEGRKAEAEDLVDENGTTGVANANSDDLFVENHLDVSEKEGWITIPQGKLPDDWDAASDIHSLRSLDRSFVFPGEQIHILACLSACKQDTEIITPFKVAAVMSKNSGGQSPDKDGAIVEDGLTWDSEVGEAGSDVYQNGKDTLNQETDPLKDISASESFLRMEEHKRQTEILLQRFKNSHFFVRIAESGEPLWSKKGASYLKPFQIDGQTVNRNGLEKTASSCLGALIDKGSFDANVSGGVARDSIDCCSLPNGDIVVLLQVNIGVNFLRDPVIEILQFEKHQNINLSQEFQDNFNGINYDPCGELLKWLLPIDNTIPPSRALSPSRVNTGPVGGTPQKPTPSSSQLFPHFRSYSMSSIPHNTVSTPQTGKSTPQTGKSQSSKPGFEIVEWNQYSSQMAWEGQKKGGEGLLSYRGVSLEQDRFSVHCGLEGIYIAGRRWRRKLEIIQPIEIRSFAADCNTDDLLCVQIKNVSPTHVAEIVVYIDAITIVFEEASKGGSPSSLPIACIEAGNDHSLPNLSLRRGEEHSFIVKPACSMQKNVIHDEKMSRSTSLNLSPNPVEVRRSVCHTDKYAIIVSCRCNYTESRMFFKQPTSWRPRIPRNLMISVASEVSGRYSEPNERDTQLPVQVLTLQASNLTSEDLTMTVLAPASFTSPPSVGSLTSPKTAIHPFVGLSESRSIISGENVGSRVQKSISMPASTNLKESSDDEVPSLSFIEQSSPEVDVIPSNGYGCTHLWLQSRVPLGRVPAQSTATIKLELLPLTDGIITLDTLQIDVKDKGVTYIPERSLKINATSSISTGIF